MFLIGYSRISVELKDAPALLELCAALGISCKSEGTTPEAEENGEERAIFICSAMAEKKLLSFAAHRGIPVKLEKRVGIPRLISAYILSPKRLGITLGLIFSCFLIIASSRTLWDIRVEGNQRLGDGEVIALLEENGVRVGMPKRKIHASAVEGKIISTSSVVSWISINIRGTVATVEIREALPAPEKSDFTVSNLVSNANGVIERFEGVKGNLSVSLGEPISEGQLLVGGIYDSNAFYGMRYTRARGKIFARCEKDFHVEIPLIYEQKVYTGEKKVKKSLIFFKKEINFFGNSRNSYPNCDKIIIEEYLNPLGLGKLPFGIRTTTYFEYETKEAKKDISVALEQAALELSQRLSDSSPEYELLRKLTQTEITDEKLILDCHIVCVQNVAVEKEIEVDILK